MKTTRQSGAAPHAAAMPIILAGAVLGAVPAIVVGDVAGKFVAWGLTPWTMGAIAGLPLFIIVMVAPLPFVAAPVEVFESSLWTLAYRELCAAPARARAPVAAAPPATSLLRVL